ncbi:YbaB/EbfC family nucleoid-associated protein [Lentzea sp. NEAU-D7]|uniref:YbaB/EbfC family nucleoid-associated protein n=1 Tax=Lentzea sp. NEAU-D7 TaxID=2994667 RepID=UPI00224B432A|nr:YbaB/EbfC family nucleoid-associated protein [Lentzea sp. NEAU-D7]MCX2952382.1 YbaB/EbfC family nucleoid-associated protein [Lentzea sp. NEAU-D7]
MQALLQQAQNMQQQMADAQQQLAETQVTGNAGNGLVTATVTGGGELVNLAIAPKIVDPEDVDTLQDLVIAAIKDANAKAQELVEQKLGPLAQGGLGGLLG